MNGGLDKWVLPLILISFLLLGSAYSLINPILESPDELLNYENIRYLAENRKLPILQPGEFSKAHHPPLYYFTGALLTGWLRNDLLPKIVDKSNPFWGYRIYDQGVDNKSQYLHDPQLEGWPYQDAVLGIRLLRFVSLLMGAGVVLAIYSTARQLFPQERALAWGAAAVAAFNPMFLYIQSSVHNDALTNLLAALTILGVVLFWTKGPSTRRIVFIAITAGLGILTKITFLFLGPMVLVAIIVRCLKDRHDSNDWGQSTVKMLAIGGGIVVLIAGWWFVRNQVLYGDLSSMRLQASIWQPRVHAPDWAAAFNELGFLRDSFWGVFGFGQIPLHQPVYVGLWLMVIIAFAGLLVWSVRAYSHEGPYRVSKVLIAVLLIAPLTAFAATFGRMTVSASANFGRYLFTTYAVIAPVLVLGLTEWFSVRWHRLVMATVSGGLFIVSLYALFAVLQPAYAAPPIYESLEQAAFSQPRTDSYPGLADLIGYDLSSGSAVPGQQLDVTLYWQVTGTTDENHPIFVQLVDIDGERIAGRDTHPGLGRYPTSRWQEGQIIEDTIPLYIPEEAQGPRGVFLNVGLRDQRGDLLQTSAGQDTISLQLIRLGEAEGIKFDIETMLFNVGDRVGLTAVDRPQLTAASGQQIPFTLTWRALRDLDEDFVVFVHLIDEQGNLAATFDHPPMNGGFPTHLWQEGDTVVDQHLIELADDIAPGNYDVRAGWYRLQDLSRLPVVDDRGKAMQDSAIPLFSLQVTE